MIFKGMLSQKHIGSEENQVGPISWKCNECMCWNKVILCIPTLWYPVLFPFYNEKTYVSEELVQGHNWE